MAILQDLIVQGSTRLLNNAYFGYVYGYMFGDISGNANTADKWKTPINLTIGGTTKIVDGTSNITFDNVQNNPMTTSTYGVGKLGTNTTLNIQYAQNKVYPVGMTADGQLAVNVPWELTDPESFIAALSQISYIRSYSYTRSASAATATNGLTVTFSQTTYNVTGTTSTKSDAFSVTLPVAGASTYGLVKIAAAAANKVGINSSGQLTYTNTDTKVTSAGNHYKPSSGTSKTVTSTDSGTLSANDKIVTTISYSVDAASHITTLTYTTKQLPNFATQTDLSDYVSKTELSNAGYVNAPMTNSTYGYAKLGDDTNLTISNSNKVYGVGITSDGKLAVSVPWSGGTGGDGNNYVNSAAFSDANNGKTLTLEREGLSQLTASLEKASTSSYGVVKVKNTGATISTTANSGTTYGVGITSTGILAYTIPNLSGFATISTLNTYINNVELSNAISGNTGMTLTLSYKVGNTTKQDTATISPMTDQNYGVAKLGTSTELNLNETNIYGVGKTSTGQLAVNVPWSDTNCYIRRADTSTNDEGLQINMTYGTSASASTYVLKFGTTTRPIIPKATDSAYGVIKTYTTAPSLTKNNISAPSSTTYRYGVSITSDGFAYVAVPWQNTNTNTYIRRADVTSVNEGLQINLAYGSSTSNWTNTYVRQFSNIAKQPIIPKATNNAYGVIKTYTAPSSLTINDISAASSTTQRYGVSITKDGVAYVAVPWENNCVDSASFTSVTNGSQLTLTKSGSNNQMYPNVVATLNTASDISYGVIKANDTKIDDSNIIESTGDAECRLWQSYIVRQDTDQSRQFTGYLVTPVPKKYFKSHVVHYAICETAGNVNVKQVECEGFELLDGAMIYVRFTNDDSSAIRLTFKVNDYTAYDMLVLDEHEQPMFVPEHIIKTGKTYLFRYDERLESWIIIDVVENNSGGNSNSGNYVSYTNSTISGLGPIYNISVVNTPGTDPNTLYIIV